MNKSILKNMSIRSIFIIVWMLAICGLLLCAHYSYREWNSTHFKTFYSHWDFLTAYFIESICFLVFFPLFVIVSKRASSSMTKKISSWFSFSVLCLTSMAVLITVIANFVHSDSVIRDYRFDRQLQSTDYLKYREAIDALIPIVSKVRNVYDEPDPCVLKSAREGYPDGQDAIGCFYYNRAKYALNVLDNSYEWNKRLASQAESDYDSAIYWFLKAAQNNNGNAQCNLGRIFTGDLPSNRYPDIKLAKLWLLKACNNNYIDAYYYLGKIYSKENLQDAYIYWSKGAELGNEDCMRALEKPEFANGMPEDKPLVQIDEAAPVDGCQ